LHGIRNRNAISPHSLGAVKGPRFLAISPIPTRMVTRAKPWFGHFGVAGGEAPQAKRRGANSAWLRRSRSAKAVLARA